VRILEPGARSRKQICRQTNSSVAGAASAGGGLRWKGPALEIDLRLTAWHGALLSIAASAVIMGALRWNPRLFLRHFPPAVRASQPPLTPHEKAVGRAIGLLLFALFLGVPLWSVRVAAQGHPGWLSLFVHGFLVCMTFNLTDWLLLDELWLGIGRPRWALPPGVSEADVPFDHAQHFRGFVTGTVLCVGVAAAVASVAR
jgi:hypothetical protein